MVAKVKTFAFQGIQALPVDVEVKISPGNPLFSIVGLPDKAVAESKERVRAAITSTGIAWPFQKITVNLAPADLQKEGTHFDLAIALAIMLEIGNLPTDSLKSCFVIGELSLDGSINKVSGVISSAVETKKQGFFLICPKENRFEAFWASNETAFDEKNDITIHQKNCSDSIIAAENLLELINHLKGEHKISYPDILQNGQNHLEKKSENYPDLSEVRGQKNAKRALEIAACGGHNLLMIGPPGTGKSMLASRLPSILPPLNLQEALEINMVASVSGKTGNYGGFDELILQRPFREVHHSCSMAAMVGGGTKAKPGEVSLAHNGVLFLDEIAEFPRQVLDSLRQPLETGSIAISRANCHITYPANFQLICAMNPCRCGFLGDPNKQCKKAPICGEEYKNKISGPLLDRIDLVIEVGRVDLFAPELKQQEETSKQVRQRVLMVRNMQKQRFDDLEISKNQQKINAKMDGSLIEKFCKIDEDSQKILQNFTNKSGSSMRAVSRILKVARTIADMVQSENIQQNHLLEAISYRRRI